jgi:hypothetical protein
MTKICEKCGNSLSIRQVVLNSRLCSTCGAKAASRRGSSWTGRVQNMKSDFEARLAAELKKSLRKEQPA